MKKLLQIMLVCGLALTVVGCGKDKKDDKKEDAGTKVEISDEGDKKENKEEGVVKDQTVDGLKFTQTSLVYQNGTSTLVTSVTNTTSKTYSLGVFYISVKDASGNEIVNLPAYAGEDIPAGETRTVTANIDQDITSAKTITYSLNK